MDIIFILVTLICAIYLLKIIQEKDTKKNKVDNYFNNDSNKRQTMKKISTTALAKANNLNVKKLFNILEEAGYITYENTITKLTDLGKKAGGEFKKGNQISGFKDYIVWPENLLDGLSIENTSTQNNKKDFREKFKAEFRTNDGHYVRSKAEVLICNYLYQNGIAHAYERKLPVEEEIYSDFYISKGKVYIEYWGYENNDKYIKRKEVKQDIYKKYNLNLIELNDKDVQQLDDVLPKMLLYFGIKVF